MVRKLILDMDPGVDDALALLAACRRSDVELMGVTVVAGNLPLETVAANASGLLSLLGSRAKVYKGAPGPLYGLLQDAADVHGPGGLGGWLVPADPSRIARMHAAQFIADTARAYPGQVTLVATGPLTNLALALEYHPGDMELLAEVVFMGGALRVPGNVTPTAEYNMFADPEAAEAVFYSGLKLTMVGLDVTRLSRLEPGDLQRLAAGTGNARAAAGMIQYFYDRHGEWPLHDPLTLTAALAPDVFTFQHLPVRIETRGDFSRGQTSADFDGSHDWPINIRAALGIDLERCRDILVDLWTRC